jgi:hypothetical protein
MSRVGSGVGLGVGFVGHLTCRSSLVKATLARITPQTDSTSSLEELTW